MHPDDLGKVIGRGGRTATALRTLVAGIGGRSIRVDVVDTPTSSVGSMDLVASGGLSKLTASPVRSLLEVRADDPRRSVRTWRGLRRGRARRGAERTSQSGPCVIARVGY